MAETYRRYGLTGGGAGSLDALDGTPLSNNDVAFTVDSTNTIYPHALNSSSGEAESSPTTIAPDTNAGNKRWKLSAWWARAYNGLTLLANAVGFSISGGTTSKTLTVEDTSLINQDLTTDASPTFVTAKLSGLTDGYVPVHTSDAVGLVNSTLKSTSGAITNASQPAFLAVPSGVQSDIATGGLVEVIWGTEVKDNASNFASNIFTAPITGLYCFSAHLRLTNLDTAATQYRMRLDTSNRSYIVTIDPSKFSADIAEYPLVISTLADMDVGDTAKINIYQDIGTAQTDIQADSWFSGYLVC